MKETPGNFKREIIFFFCIYRSEEIPLEDFPHSRNNSPHGRTPSSSSTGSRSHTPSRAMHFDISVHNASPRRDNSLLTQSSVPANHKENTLQTQKSSEETSFIATEEESTSGARRKGLIETV